MSANTTLTTLSCFTNQLTTLNVNNNTVLNNLYCYDNQLTTLDVSSNTALSQFAVSTNQLSTLDISTNTALTWLWCNNNQLTALDVSTNTALTILYCNNNQMTTLDMSNGVTDQLTTFDATNNSLDCIEVNAEDVDYATTNWTSDNGNIDEGVTFANICLSNPNYTNVPDDNFEQALIDLGYDDTIDDFVITANISGVTFLDVGEKDISDLT